jgi:hypothetical protein
MNSISGQLERLSVVAMESTIPPGMTVGEWRRSAKVVPPRPTLRAACRKRLGRGRMTYEGNP